MIRLNNVYQGKLTNEQPILPGNYAENDTCLFGLADYLLQNGHAAIISENEAVASYILHAEAERQLEAEQLQRETDLLAAAEQNRIGHDEVVNNPRRRKRN